MVRHGTRELLEPAEVSVVSITAPAKARHEPGQKRARVCVCFVLCDNLVVTERGSGGGGGGVREQAEEEA